MAIIRNNSHSLIFRQVVDQLDIVPHKVVVDFNFLGLGLGSLDVGEVEVAKDTGGLVDQVPEGTASCSEAQQTRHWQIRNGIAEDEGIAEGVEEGQDRWLDLYARVVVDNSLGHVRLRKTQNAGRTGLGMNDGPSVKEGDQEGGIKGVEDARCKIEQEEEEKESRIWRTRLRRYSFIAGLIKAGRTNKTGCATRKLQQGGVRGTLGRDMGDMGVRVAGGGPFAGTGGWNGCVSYGRGHGDGTGWMA